MRTLQATHRKKLTSRKCLPSRRLQLLSEMIPELPNIFRRLYWDVRVNAILSSRDQNGRKQNGRTYKNSLKKQIVWIHQSIHGQNDSLTGWRYETNTQLTVVQTMKNTRGVFDQRLVDLTLLDKDRNFAKRRRCPPVTSFSVTSADKHYFQFCHFNIWNRFQEQVPDISMNLAI